MLTVVLLAAAWRWPARFPVLIQVLFLSVYASILLEVTAFDGLVPSGLSAIFGIALVLASMVGFGFRVAAWWLGAFVVAVMYALVIPDLIDPWYVPPDPTGDIAFNLVTTGVLTFAVLTYFIRQRDRFSGVPTSCSTRSCRRRSCQHMKDGAGTIAPRRWAGTRSSGCA